MTTTNLHVEKDAKKTKISQRIHCRAASLDLVRRAVITCHTDLDSDNEDVLPHLYLDFDRENCCGRFHPVIRPGP